MAGTMSKEIRKYTGLAFEINACIMRKFKKIKIVPEPLSRNILVQVPEVSEALYSCIYGTATYRTPVLKECTFRKVTFSGNVLFMLCIAVLVKRVQVGYKVTYTSRTKLRLLWDRDAGD
jgi:hypothetical protein